MPIESKRKTEMLTRVAVLAASLVIPFALSPFASAQPPAVPGTTAVPRPTAGHRSGRIVAAGNRHHSGRVGAYGAGRQRVSVAGGAADHRDVVTRVPRRRHVRWNGHG